MSGHESDEQHDRKSEQILGIGDTEREVRRHEEKIESRDIEQRRECRRAAAESVGDEHYPQQEHHDYIGKLQVLTQGYRRHGDADAGQSRVQVTAQLRLDPRFLMRFERRGGRAARSRFFARHGDKVDVRRVRA